MKRGQTAILNLLAKILVSVSGFVANWFIARKLGSDALGTYLLVASVLAWMVIGGNAGIPIAIKKRISEGTDEGRYLNAGLVLQMVILGFVIGLTVLFWGPLRSYLGIDILGLFVALLCAYTMFYFVSTVLDGQQKVHISSAMLAANTVSRSVIQVGVVLLGFGLLGLLWGYLIGFLVAVALGVVFVSYTYVRPSKSEILDLLSYAQYSWLGSVKSRTYSSMDTMVLAVFVTKSLIGIYGIAWNVASVLAIFGGAISTTLFPEISSMAGERDRDRIGDLVEASLAYAGLFIIPGLAGGAIVGDVVLSIYGREFVQGTNVLLILIFAQLLYTYETQFMNALNAIDRPDITFRITAIFVITNLSLNVVLISMYGWYGAAVATAASSGLSAVLGYRALSRHVRFDLPLGEVSKQVVSAALMAGVVFVGVYAFGKALVITIALIGVGAGVYFATMFAISAQFRKTVRDNFPQRIVREGLS